MDFQLLGATGVWKLRLPMDSTKPRDMSGGMFNKTNPTDRPNFADSSDSQTNNKYGLLACDYDIY